MVIKRSKNMERKVLDKIKAHLSRAPRSTDKWHVSDLLYPRKAVFGRLDPQPMTDLQALYFTAGRAHHGMLEACLGKYTEEHKKQRKDRADAGEFEKHGIYYSPDLRMPYPWEIKTSRSEYEPRDLEKGYEGYLKQLKQYQACMEDDRGGLLVFFLNLKQAGQRFKRPAIRFYKVLLTAKERAAKLAWMKKTAALMDVAQKKKDVSKLELCPQWMCRDCPWFKKCKPWLQDKSRKNAQREE